MTSRSPSEPIFLVSDSGDAPESPETMGFKAWNLLRMARIGLPVPAAFVLGTGFCRGWYGQGGALPGNFRELLAQNVRRIESASGAGFGSTRRPLLVSVRSGAAVSMPGMLDTVLNVGLCDAVIRGMLRTTGNPRLVWDSYRRLIQSFGEVVAGCEAGAFAEALAGALHAAGAAQPRELDFKSLERLCAAYLDIYEESAGVAFPQDPIEQLEASIVAVFRSWMSDRALAYRRLAGIDDAIGTAVTVQRMMFGNAGGTSGAGVAFTRNPATGENELYLDYAANAQGEDVVSGRCTPGEPDALAETLPRVFEELLAVRAKLEREFGDAQEFEFTVENGRLALLQTRTGKRTPLAALRIAVEQVREGLIAPAEALARLSGIDLAAIRDRRLGTGAGEPLCRAVPASAGVAAGEIALDPVRATERSRTGAAVILVREDIATDDIAGIQAAAGILTAAGGRTSHAAVVARQLDRVCLVGCTALSIDPDARRCTLGARSFAEGDVVTLDGRGGAVYAGAPAVEEVVPREYLAEVVRWRDEAVVPMPAG